MDILKRIDQAMQFCRFYAEGGYSIETEKWNHHVTPEFIEDIRQYIESLQLKLMHEQTKQATKSANPVAWAHEGPLGYSFSHVHNEAFNVPLYAHPAPQPIDLVKQLVEACEAITPYSPYLESVFQPAIKAGRAWLGENE